MPFLDKAEDWLIRRTLQPVYNVGQSIEPPNDDKPIALALFLIAMLATVVTCGHCLAR